MNVNNKFKWVLLFTVCCMSWGWLTSSVEAEGYGTANSDEYLNKIAISAPGTEFYTGSMTFRPDTSNEFLIDGFQNNNGIQIAVTLNRQDPNIVYIHELGPRDDIRNKYTLSKGGTVNSKILVGHRYKYLSDYPNLLFERYDNSKSLWKLKRNLLRNDTETYGKAVVPLPTKINQNIDYIVAGSAQVDPESGKLIQGDKLLRTQNQWGYQGENYTTSAPETITRDGKIYKLVQKLPENQNGKMSAYIDGWTATYWYGTYGLRYTQIDDTGLQLVELLRPNQSVEQSVTLAPGERHVFPNKGTAKGPVNAVNVYNGQDLESYEIVYEYEEQGGAKTRPVDSDGNEITHDNLEFPRIHGNPGEKVMIDPNDLPNLLGYHKPKNSFEVIIPQEGGVIDIPYQSAKEMPEVKDGKSNNRDYEWYIDQASVSGNQPLVTCTVMAIKWYNETSEVTVEDALKWNEKKWDEMQVQFYMYNNKVSSRVSRDQTIEDIKNRVDENKIVITYIDSTALTYNNLPEARDGRFYQNGGQTNVIVKGYRYVNGKLYFECYDPNSQNQKYTNGELKGKNRLYDANEFAEAMVKYKPSVHAVGD